ncbi:flagellar hook-basal body complex protein [Oscillospiraceae bacterium OttesenSCG-928-F05]|nr:flagellar hook-basal body complex protein [Oscillospiraceae bacterium OttesenSCG-928-F05]
MLRSLNSAVSGMKNHQTRLDVIANNVANVNTYGFKSSRVVFKEMYNQTVQGASASSQQLGGTNPRQIGLGMSVGAIDVQMQGTGSAYTTDNTFDLMLEGDGFFIAGERVVDETTNPATVTYNEHYTRAGNFYLVPSGLGTMKVNTWKNAGTKPDDPTDDVYEMQDRNMFDLVTQDGLFVLGTMADPTSNTTDQKGWPDKPVDLKEPMVPIRIPEDAYNVKVDQQGNISFINKNNEIKYIGKVCTAQFVNPGGLEKIGDNLYDQTSNSGIVQYTTPGDPGAGTVKSGALEMSNTNLAQEFTDLITTQRGYQANSRIITVSDTILEELVNLKR